MLITRLFVYGTRAASNGVMSGNSRIQDSKSGSASNAGKRRGSQRSSSRSPGSGQPTAAPAPTAPVGSSGPGDSGQEDGLPDDVTEQEPQIVPLDVSTLQKVAGYESVGYYSDCKLS